MPPFKQYTRCIEPADVRSRKRYITIAILLAGTPAALIAVAAGHLVCWVIALEIAALAGLVAYYHNWLYQRLICLGGDRDCIGAIVSIEPPALKWNFFDRDTDYSINLLLKNTEYGAPDADQDALQAAAEQTVPYGELIKPQDGVLAIGLKPRGLVAHENDDETKPLAAVLHAEFEGDGNYRMLQASKILLAFAIYALIACLSLPWPIDLILGFGLFLFSILLLFVASLSGLFGEGSPSDVNAGDLTDDTGVNTNGQGIGADVVLVRGSWVCDPLHDDKWNEIHPIKKCMKMGKWEGEWPTEDNILQIRHGLQVAEAEETIANQARPEYQWQIHPDLDGCERDVIL